MATQNQDTIPMQLIDPIETAINESIDSLIISLQQRRGHLLTLLRGTREEMKQNQAALREKEEQLVESRKMLLGLMTHNDLHTMQERMVADLEAKWAELQANSPSTQEVRLLCDTRDLEEHIYHLGEIVRLEVPPIHPMLHANNPLLLLEHMDHLLEG